MSALNLAVVGTGHWGRNHARVAASLAADGRIDGAIVCDLDPARAKAVAEPLDLPWTTSLDDVFADDDVAGCIFATPTPSHFPLAKRALESGRDVLVEKPMTATYQESQELCGIAEAGGRILMPGHIFRYHPAIAPLRRLIQDGAFGKVLALRAVRRDHRAPRSDMGVVPALGVHELDLFGHLLGEAPVDVQAFTSGHFIPGIEEDAHLHLRFPSGATAYALETWWNPARDRERSLHVIGSEGGAYVDFMRSDAFIVQEVEVTGDAAVAPGLAAEMKAHRTIEVPPQEPLRAEVEDFVRSIRTRKAPLADMQAGAEAVRWVEKALA